MGDRDRQPAVAKPVGDPFARISSAAQHALAGGGRIIGHDGYDAPVNIGLLEGVARHALCDGLDGAATSLAAEAVHDSDPLVAKPMHLLTTESFRTILRSGLEDGLRAGSAKLRGANPRGSSIEALVESQRAACAAAYSAAHMKVANGSDVGDAAGAQNLMSERTQDGLTCAGEAHGQAVFDAWLSYIAQENLGATDHDDPRGGKDTKMEAGATPAAPGVLMVEATLSRAPRRLAEVTDAQMAGVNKLVRICYSHRSIASFHIPRVVHATIAGDSTKLVISYDEAGHATIDGDDAAKKWLADLASTGGDVATGALVERGAQLLLEYLHVGDVR